VVEPAGDRMFVLALDVGAHRLAAARIGLCGQVFDRRELVQSPADYDVGRTLGRVGRLTAALLAAAPEGSSCLGVGVGICGVVRHDDGLVRFAPNLGWVDVPFGRLVADLPPGDLPVTVGNDADLGAIAEHVRGAAVGADNVVYIACEVGVGGGLILDGVPLAGAGGYGGEVGHMVVNPRGRRCRCGARGCWETEIGEDAILLAAGLEPGNGTGVARVIEAAAAGDRRSRAALHRVGGWLGIGVANLVNLFNPEVVVFGGVLRQVLPEVEREVRRALELALTAPCEQVRLVTPALGADSVILGAAEAALQRLLDDPIGVSAALGRDRRDAAAEERAGRRARP
jgi:predicted NBD/HSP70 family sugar kinase